MRQDTVIAWFPSRGLSSFGTLALTAWLAAGCAPTCEQSCRKLLFDCELDTERVALDECQTSCLRQEALYESWENQELTDLFRDHRRCVASSSCDEIADGACYEGYEDLFLFDPASQSPPE